MQNFIIKQLRVSGPGKQDGVVHFKDGLNIIQGRSNTGKTWILKEFGRPGRQIDWSGFTAKAGD